MRYRPLGNTGLRVSELGLGCSALGGGLFGPSDRDAARLVHRCLDAGVTFFDTSDTYSLGNSEKVLGRALRGRRDQVVIATKGGGTFGLLDRALLRSRPLLRPLRTALGPARRSIKLAHARRKHYDYSPAHLIGAVEASLTRLGTDYIDLYQLYNPTLQDLQTFAAADTLEKLKAAGKIRHYGVTVYEPGEAHAALEHSGVAALQVAISLIDQNACTDVLAGARTRGVGVIAASPLGEGLLTNTVGITKADESSHHTPQEIAARRALAASCARWVRPERTLAQTALRFVLSLEGVSVAIPSAVSAAELEENLGAIDSAPLSEEELASMRRLSHAMHAGIEGHEAPLRAV